MLDRTVNQIITVIMTVAPCLSRAMMPPEAPDRPQELDPRIFRRKTGAAPSPPSINDQIAFLNGRPNRVSASRGPTQTVGKPRPSDERDYKLPPVKAVASSSTRSVGFEGVEVIGEPSGTGKDLHAQFGVGLDDREPTRAWHVMARSR